MMTAEQIQYITQHIRAHKIYAIIDPYTNLPVYVGVTVRPLKTRLRAHRVNKVGAIGRFMQYLKEKEKVATIILIKECNPNEDWQTEEKRIISEYMALYPDLLNQSIGGMGPTVVKLSPQHIKAIVDKTSIPIYLKSISSGIVSKYDSISEASKKLDVSKASICNAVKRKGAVKGFLASKDLIFNQTENSKRYGKYRTL